MAGVYVTALRILARSRLTEAALCAKLERKGFTEEEIRAAIRRCKAERFVDDRLFAQLHVAAGRARRNVGDRRLVAELVRKGIDPEAAREAVSIVEEESARDERARLEAAMQRMLRLDPDRSDASLARSLERLGFAAPLIYGVLRERAACIGPLADLESPL